MSEQSGTPPAPPPEAAPAPPGAPGADAAKKKKKQAKVRSAWISFTGRIVAQVIGAAATIGLSILVVRQFNAPDGSAVSAPPGGPSGSSAVAPAARVRREGEVALAVLPLINLSDDPTQEYFADGMTEALITNLAQLKGIRVISRTSSMYFKGQKKPLPEIARELGVNLIVEGSVAQVGNRVRVTAQLIDAERDEHIWAHTYDSTIKDVLALQNEMAATIAREVKGVLSTTERSRLALRQNVDPAIYDLYLRGRFAWNLRTPAGMKEAIGCFEQVVQRDPTFALGYAGLADAYQLLGSAPDGANGSLKAKSAVARALELDPALAEAHASLAGILHRTDGDLQGADREFRRALDLNPGYATAHQWYAILLAEEGRDEEATERASRAVMLDPMSAAIRQTLGLVHYYGRRYQQAVAAERRALELAPELPLARQILARSLVLHGAPREAIEVYAQDASPANPDRLATLSLAYARAGDRARADATLKQLLAREPPPAVALAQWYAASGNHARALEVLERLVAERPLSIQPLKADPLLDGVRSNPRFAAVLRRAKS